MIGKFAKFVGPLRTMLYLSVALLIITAAFSFGETQKSGIMMFPTLIVPAIVPMLFFVIPLDMTMCGILMSGKDEAARSRYRKMILYDLIAMVLLFAAWWPFYYRLLLS